MRYNIHIKYKNKYVNPLDAFETCIIEMTNKVYSDKIKKVEKNPVYNYHLWHYMDEYVNISTEYFSRVERYWRTKILMQECTNTLYQQTEFEKQEPLYNNTNIDKQESIVQQYLFNFTMDIK